MYRVEKNILRHARDFVIGQQAHYLGGGSKNQCALGKYSPGLDDCAGSNEGLPPDHGAIKHYGPNADLATKQRALEKLAPAEAAPFRFKPSDSVLAFLKQL